MRFRMLFLALLVLGTTIVGTAQETTVVETQVIPISILGELQDYVVMDGQFTLLFKEGERHQVFHYEDAGFVVDMNLAAPEDFTMIDYMGDSYQGRWAIYSEDGHVQLDDGSQYDLTDFVDYWGQRLTVPGVDDGCSTPTEMYLNFDLGQDGEVVSYGLSMDCYWIHEGVDMATSLYMTTDIGESDFFNSSSVVYTNTPYSQTTLSGDCLHSDPEWFLQDNHWRLSGGDDGYSAQSILGYKCGAIVNFLHRPVHLPQGFGGVISNEDTPLVEGLSSRFFGTVTQDDSGQYYFEIFQNTK